MISWGIHFNPKQTCSPHFRPLQGSVWMPCGMKNGLKSLDTFILGVQFFRAFSHTALAAAGNHLLTQTCETEPEGGCCRREKCSFYYKVEEITRDLASGAWSAQCCILELTCSAANKHHDSEESTSWPLSECHISSTFCSELSLTSTIKKLRSVPSKISFSEGLFFLSFGTVPYIGTTNKQCVTEVHVCLCTYTYTL